MNETCKSCGIHDECELSWKDNPGVTDCTGQTETKERKPTKKELGQIIANLQNLKTKNATEIGFIDINIKIMKTRKKQLLNEIRKWDIRIDAIGDQLEEMEDM